MTYLNDLTRTQTEQIAKYLWQTVRQSKPKPLQNKQVIAPLARKVRNKVMGRARRVITRFTVLKSKSEMIRVLGLTGVSTRA